MIAVQLLEYERSVIKKTPMFLQLNQFDKALITAIEYGDINIINKVIADILSKRGKNDEWLQKFLTQNPIAKEKFVNYAK